MSKTPKVSIVSVTYNQEQYVRQAFDSFIAQRTTFPVEVIVADDCSTDSTPDIIKEYAQKHPELFKPILRKKNIGVGANFKDAMQAAKGDYIALCEGDDYWTDSSKLQRQTDFLDRHPDYTVCFHPVKVFFESGERESYVYPSLDSKPKLTTAELLRENFIQTNSVMYRRQSYDDLPVNILPVDWYLHMYHAKSGKTGMLNKVMSAYRRHKGGLWWNSFADIDKIWSKYGIQHLELYVEFQKLFADEPQYQTIINQHIVKMLTALVKTDQKYDKNLVSEAIKQFPESIEIFITGQHGAIRQLENTITAKETAIHELNLQAQRREQALAEMRSELEAIKSSRAWKMRNRVAKVAGRKAV